MFERKVASPLAYRYFHQKNLLIFFHKVYHLQQFQLLQVGVRSKIQFSYNFYKYIEFRINFL